jgi:gas vesicle protein
VSEGRAVLTGALMGALIGGAAGYLFFTESGRVVRDRLEPAVDELRREFARFQRTIEKVGDMASEGIRVVQEFNAARGDSPYPGGGTSH